MTFTEIRDRVADLYNQSSAEALDRIEKSINERNRSLITSCNLPTSIRSQTTTDTVIGSRFASFEDVIKVESVFYPTTSPDNTLSQLTVDEVRNYPVSSGPPSFYAIYTISSNSVTIFMDSETAAVYTLGADVLESTVTLEDDDEPVFPAEFHDILIVGAGVIELQKMEKYEMASVREQEFQARAADLRYFIHKNAYLNIVQNKYRRRIGVSNVVVMVP